MSKETTLVYLMVGIALLQGVTFLKYAISASSRTEPSGAFKHGNAGSDEHRIERADDNRERISPLARYVVSAVGFIMAGALLAHLITPAIAYAFISLAMAGRCVVDQIVEERTPRRRTALIGRKRSIDPVLVIWVVLSGATALALVPWLLEPPYRNAAVVVAVCMFIMVVLAWRIANAPLLLFGNDLEAEQVVDRETRVLRTGNACGITVGTVAVFNAFIGGQQGFIDHRLAFWALWLLWFALFAWRSIYAHHLTRTPLTS